MNSDILHTLSTLPMNELQSAPVAVDDLSLKVLADRENLSVRAYNVCNVNGLRSLRAILDFYHRVGTFTKLRNAGRLTEDELVGLCHKYDGISPGELQELISEGDRSAQVDWAGLTVEQRAAIDRHFRIRLDALSTRAKGVLSYIVPRIDRSAALFTEFFDDPKHRQPGIFTHVGRVTIEELLGLREELLQLATSLQDGAVEQILFRQNVDMWKERFVISEDDLLHYRQDFIVRRFPLFQFLNELFERKAGVGDREVLLMKHRYNYHLGSEKLALEKLAEMLGLTRERVRQLATAIPSKLRELVAKIGPIYDFVNYEALYCRNRDLIIIDEEFAECINAREGVSFATPFYATVLEAFLKDSHDRIEEDFDGATDYLVSRELSAVFDFDAYLRELAERLSARVSETYTLDMSRHLKTFWTGEDEDLLPRVAAVAELLAREEFGVQADLGGNLVVQRNTKRRTHEFIIDILNEAGQPMHVEDIFKIIEERHPGMVSSPEAVRGFMLRYDCFSRYEASSTYGLREWEQQYSHLKSGTFADIAEEFLGKFNQPRHVSEVADYVMQYRNTNRESVIYTLKADISERFRFFDGGMIGLSAADYSNANLNYRPLSGRVFDSLRRLIRDNGNAISLARLVDYCILHYRMPEQQARTVFERAFREGRLLVDNEVVSVPEGAAEEPAQMS